MVTVDGIQVQNNKTQKHKKQQNRRRGRIQGATLAKKKKYLIAFEKRENTSDDFFESR